MKTQGMRAFAQKYDSMVKLLKKYWWKFMIVINFFVLLFAGLRYSNHMNNLYSISFSEDELAAFTSEDSAALFGGTIDESYSPGLYDLYPESLLRTGCYRYDVEYESSITDSIGFPHSYVEYYDGFDGDRITYFNEQIGSNSDIFWMNIDLNMTFRVYYKGTGEISFRSFSIEELPYGAYMDLFWAVLFLVIVDIIICLIVYGRNHPMKEQNKYVVCGIFAIVLVASFPMLGGYMINGNDLDFHLVRIEGIKDALLCGQFPVRINPTFYNGYGYANSIMYGEVLFYIPAFLRMVGFSLTESYLILLGMIHLLTAAICYFSVNGIIKNYRIALVGTVLYTLAPYRLMDTYLRAAIGEVLAMAFLPLVIYGMYRIYTMEDTTEKTYKWSFIPLLVGLTGILQSHVLTGEMIAVFIMITCILLFPKTLQKKRFLALLKTAVFLILINIWFLVPFVDYTMTQDLRFLAKAQSGGTEFVQGTGAYLVQLLYVFFRYSWNHFVNSDIIADEMPLALGLALVLGMFLCLAMVWSKGNKNKRREALFILLLGFVATWMATLYFPWDKLSTMNDTLATVIASIQFVWRYLSPATALTTVATCMGLNLLEEKEGKVYSYTIAAILCAIALISGMHFMQQCFNNQAPIMRENTSDMDTRGAASGGEYVLSAVDFYTVNNVYEPRPSEECVVSEYEKEGTTITMTVVNGNSEGYILLPLLHYKGYVASSADGLITTDNLETGEFAVIKLKVPANYSGEIEVSYGGMWYWRVAEICSVLVFVYLFGGYIYYRKQLMLGRK